MSKQNNEFCDFLANKGLYETKEITKDTCLMKHHLDFIVVTDGNVMRKIGQYPSFIDLSSYELKEYQKSMSKQDEKEFKSAEMLYSMGMGIGAFAYLRRIFERIIAEAEKMAIDNKEFNESDFANCHIKEKVKKLKQYLPKSMSDNTSFYKVVSEGIHNFNDKECIENYETLKHFIVTFFREKDNLRREKEEKKRYESSLNRISSKIK